MGWHCIRGRESYPHDGIATMGPWSHLQVRHQCGPEWNRESDFNSLLILAQVGGSGWMGEHSYKNYDS